MQFGTRTKRTLRRTSMSPHLPNGLTPREPLVDRRTWLATSAAGLGLAVWDRGAGALAGQKKDSARDADQKDFAARRLAYLKPLVYSRDDIADWLAGKA